MNLFRFAREAFSASPFRTLEYEALSRAGLSGRVLDLGGGDVSNYHALLPGCRVASIDLSPAVRPTVVADITRRLPWRNGSFDAVVSLSCLEHVTDYEAPLHEARRVLRAGGRLVLCMPFLHQIHGAPDDYWRLSGSALAMVLARCGFSSPRVEPLGRGVLVARYSLLFPLLPRLLRPLFAAWAWAADETLLTLSSRYRAGYGPDRYPLGYFAVAEVGGQA